MNLNFQPISVFSVLKSSLNFMLSWVEHEKSFITSDPEGEADDLTVPNKCSS